MWSEYVEVADGDRLQSVNASKAAHVVLAGQFADRVRGNGVG